MPDIQFVLIVAFVLILIFVLKVDIKWAALTGGILVLLAQDESEKDKEEKLEAAEQLEKEAAEHEEEAKVAREAAAVLRNEKTAELNNRSKEQNAEIADIQLQDVGKEETLAEEKRKEAKKLKEEASED